jgi:hypothetical protein
MNLLYSLLSIEGFKLFVILQIFSTALGKCCEQKGLSVEVIDLASFDPEERLLEEVCCVCVY